MVIRIVAAAIVLMMAAPVRAMADQAPAAAAAAAGQTATPGKKDASAEPKQKKPKKAKKPKSGVPAPDEPVDPEAEPAEGGKGFRASWKQHPSIRAGNVFRIDFEAKFQEDGRKSYEGAAELEPWELHRNRVGIQGHLFKKIEYEVERELTEKELTEKDITAGVAPK
jgi:hypothetical protein